MSTPEEVVQDNLIKERLSHPVIGPIIISFFIWNYEVLIWMLGAVAHPGDAVNGLNSWRMTVPWWRCAAGPFLSGLAYTFGGPWILTKYHLYQLWIERERINNIRRSRLKMTLSGDPDNPNNTFGRLKEACKRAPEIGRDLAASKAFLSGLNNQIQKLYTYYAIGRSQGRDNSAEFQKIMGQIDDVAKETIQKIQNGESYANEIQNIYRQGTEDITEFSPAPPELEQEP